MYGTPQMVLNISPEQFEQILDDRISNAFQKFSPELAIKLVASIKEPELPEMASPKQVCSFLQISRPTLLAMSKDTPDRTAILIAQRVGKRVLYKREDVLAVLSEYRRFKS